MATLRMATLFQPRRRLQSVELRHARRCRGWACPTRLADEFNGGGNQQLDSQQWIWSKLGIKAMSLEPEIAFTKRVGHTLMTCYRFAHPGRRLKMHEHTFGHWSVLIVGGMVIRFEDGRPPQNLDEPMQWVLFLPKQRHELEATVAGTICLQIQEV